MRSRLIVPALLTAPVLVLAGCGADSGDGGAEDPVAVATTSILGSVLGQITECAGTTSTALMGPGEDPHTFQPSSEQVADLVSSDLVVANGLGLEGGLTSALANATEDGTRVFEVAPLVDPLPWGGEEPSDEHAEGEDHSHEEDETDHADESGHEHDDHAHEEDEAQAGSEEHDHAGHAHGDEDPHFWLDASRVATAAGLIGEELADATGDDSYIDCGAQVEESIGETDAEVRDILSGIPEEQRVLITDHEAFGYFTSAYDFEQAGVVIPGGSTDAEPSSAELAELASVITDTGVPVLFSNSAVSSSLVDAVAAEAGTDVEVVELFVASIGPEGSGAETYQDLMVENAHRMADALG